MQCRAPLRKATVESGCDAVVVVSSPEERQRQRVLARLGMTAAKLQAILARQVPFRVERLNT